MDKMEFLHLRPIEGVPSTEKTAITMKSIKELLAEDEAARAAQAASIQTAPSPKSDVAPQSDAAPLARLQRPPHHFAPLPPVDAPVTAPAPRATSACSLLGRLFGR